MPKINRGIFIKNNYEKQVDFSKAVLWKTREISIPPEVFYKIFKTCKLIIFYDRKKNERWTVDVTTAFNHKVLKKEGQESQYYFPISIFKVEPIKPKPTVK